MVVAGKLSKVNVVFSLFDAFCIVLFLLGGGAFLALLIGVGVWLAARLAGEPDLSWQRLALALIPVAGMGLCWSVCFYGDPLAA